MACSLETIKKDSIKLAVDVFMEGNPNMEKVSDNEVFIAGNVELNKPGNFNKFIAQAINNLKAKVKAKFGDKFTEGWIKFIESDDNFNRSYKFTFPNNLEEAYRKKLGLPGQQKTLFQKQTMSSEGQIASEKTIRDLAARISDRIGIPYKIISDRTQEFKGKIKNNVAIINLAYATLDTPIHEILGHPIIRAIKKQGEVIEYSQERIKGEIEITQKLIKKEITKEQADKLKKSLPNHKYNQLYQNLLKELEYGKGKEVLDRIKRDYSVKSSKYEKLEEENDINHIESIDIFKVNNTEYKYEYKEFEEYSGYYPSFTKDGKEIEFEEFKQAYNKNIDSLSVKYTLEEQQEEAIVELLGLYTAEKLDAVKDGKLISLLKRLLKEMKQFVRSLLSQREVEIDKLPDNMTLGDLSDLLAYSNSKLILPGNEVVYTTPDNQQFKTYAEASNHISDLAKSVKDVDLDKNISVDNIDKEIETLQKELDNFKFETEPFNKFIDVYTKKGRLRQNYWARKKDGTTGWTGGSKETLIEPEYDGFVLDTNRGDGRFITKISDKEAEELYYAEENKFNITTKASREKYAELETKIHNLKNNSLKGFIEKNKEYEQSKEIIEEWKKINNIQYNPEEIYSRGQEFSSVVGAYSSFDVNLMMQNLLSHIEDNEKAGGKFAISAFTKPIDKQIGHLEGGGGKIKFKIFPKSEDILWAANTDVYSGSVWDASEKVSKDKKSELLGVSYTKYPSLRNIDSVQPNLANIVDDLSHHHNELGIVLTGNNFRLEYDEDIPYSTKKIIDSINSILDQKYGKLVKPEIKEKTTKLKEVYELQWNNGNVIGRFNSLEEAKKEQFGEYTDSVGNKISAEEATKIVKQSIDIIGIQPTQTNRTLKESIESVKNKSIYYTEKYNLEIEELAQEIDNLVEKYDGKDEVINRQISKLKEKRNELIKKREESLPKKEYTSQALINTKIAKLKEVAKKYPRSLIRSEVKPIDDTPFGNRIELFEDDDLPFQKIPLQSELEQIVKEIENTDKSVIVSNVDEYFDVISKHLRNLRERKSYQRLKKIFTTEENINKLSTLQDILSEAKKAQDDIEDDRRRIRAIAQTIVQIDHLSDLILEDIKSIVKNTDDSIENLHILQTYLNTINDWDILLEEANKSFAVGNPTTTKKIGEVKLKLNQIESYIAKNDESGVVKTLQKILIPASQDLIKVINGEKKLLEEKLQRQIDRKADAKTIAETKKLIKAKEDKIKEINFENTQNVIDFLKGKRGDASVWNTWLESFRDSSDPTISAFAQFVKEQIDEVNNRVYKIDLQYQKDLAPLIKESERLDPTKLNSKLVFTDTIIQDGERTSILTLLNEYGNGYRADYSEKLNKEAELKDKWKESKLEEDKQEYLQAKKDRQKFEQDFLHTEFKPEVYEKYKLFEDEIGQELKQEIDTIFNKISIIDEGYKLRGHELTEEQTLKKEAYLLQYKMLGNLNKPDGTPKTGKELDKAKRMQEIRALNRQFYIWKDNLTQFEKAKERHSESLLSKGVTLDSQEYKDEMFKWEENNTRTVIKDEFYKTRDAIVREIALLTKKFKNKDLEENISELWKTIQSITYGLRDEDGQPIGILVQEKGAERIKIAQEAIQELQDKVTKISGLTKQEQEDLNNLYSKAKSGVITQEERIDLEDLIAKSKTEGLSDREKKRLFDLFSQLQELQSNIPTEYYTQTANNITTKYGVTLLDSGDILEEDRVVSFLQSNKLQELLKHKDFKNWFDLNHYQVEKFNKETKQVEKQWKRTYQWNRIVPNDPKFIDVKPALKYSYREIKPEYKTERIVGKTVDNKGNWLPDLSKSDKYKNQTYFNLINSNDPESKRLSKILNTHTKYLLDTQEGLARTNKLYLDVPRVEREGKEQNITFAKQALESPGDIPKHIWERIKEKYRQLTNYDIQETRYESPFEGKYDKDFIKVPMKYVGKVSVDQVSLDLQRSISKYTYASELNKQLVESLPVARAIQRVVEREDQHKPFKKKSSNRINAIRRIITKEYEGQKSNLELQNLGALEKPLTATINLAKYLAVQSTIRINLPASIANYVNAEMQNLINAGNDLYSNKTYATSLDDYSTRFFPAWQRDYYENKLGNLSLESQLVDVWNPVQSDEIQKTIGEKFSKSVAYDTLSANWLFNTREWGEFFVQSRTWISTLKETKVDLGQDVISLIDAYELDDKGFIKLKDGVDKSWDIGGENFNRLKYKIQALNRKIHGNYASYDKTQIEMFAIGSLAMFLKRFFISMAANRFAYGDNIHEGRFNISAGTSSYGYYTQTLSIATKQLKNGLKDWDLLSIQEKQALGKTAKELGVMLGALALMSLMGYSGDDKNKKKKLKEYSWLELNTLYQLDRLFVETTSFLNPKSYFDYTLDFQIKTALEKWYKLLTDIISQEEYKSTLKSSDGNVIYKKGDKKWKTQAKRATGIQQMLLFKEDPDVMLINYDKTTRSR